MKVFSDKDQKSQKHVPILEAILSRIKERSHQSEVPAGDMVNIKAKENMIAAFGQKNEQLLEANNHE